MKTLSLVIPATPGDAHYLPELLNAINRGPHWPNEIIISISKAQDVPAELIKDIENAFGKVEKGGLILNKDLLLAADNRNRGAQLAQGEIVAFFDADDLPHERLFEMVVFIFENQDILHLNHCCSREPLDNATPEKILTVDSSVLYPRYFPEDNYPDCVYYAGAYGADLFKQPEGVATGHTYVHRSVLEDIAWRGPQEKQLRKGEDYEFCMEVLYKKRKSMIINSVLSWYRPSIDRGRTTRHGYENANYVSV
ncbi:MAG TPA: glycosyltransferase family 2 protein [Rhodocyclaceae bacterium]|jgi:glycosyltransferase involved in cell wall biosynthesis|nr:glycosyltransferase family 2 protein [Rhodocyclaceae bacterium]